MTKKLLTLPLLFLVYFSFSQSADTSNYRSNNDTTIHEIVDTEAAFPDGQTGWVKFLQKNLDASVPVENGAKKGKYIVAAKFVVTKDGKVKDIVAETKYRHGMEEELIRILKITPAWIPAKIKGQNVNSYKRQTITFVVSVK